MTRCAGYDGSPRTEWSLRTMAFKLTKTQRANLDALWAAYESAVADLRAADEVATAAINVAASDFRNAIDAAVAEVDVYVTDCNSAAEALHEELDGIVSDLENEFDERSEKWQEGDVGAATRAWLDRFNATKDDLPEIESPSVDYSNAADDGVERAVDLSEVPESFDVDDAP